MMDRECIEHAKAQLIEAERRKKAERQSELTVGNFFENIDQWKKEENTR